MARKLSPAEKAKRRVIDTARAVLTRIQLRKGAHPDRFTIATQPTVDEAAKIEQAIIDIARDEAIKETPDRGRMTRRLRSAVAYGLGRLTRAAKRTEEQAEELGTVSIRRTAMPPREQRPTIIRTTVRRVSPAPLPEPDDDDLTLGVPDNAPGTGARMTAAQARALAKKTLAPPRSTETGNTVRVPKALHESFRELAPRLIGSGSELFDDIVNELAKNPPTSDIDRRRTAQKVLDRFHQRGVTGFVDKAGRRWNLTSYVEMATRTASTAIAREAQVAEMLRVGMDLVRVTVMPNCNPLCQPFQGRLLSLTGAAERDTLGEPVVTTLRDALTRGYNHPNCRHTIVPHLPGGELPDDPDSINPGDYKAVQELRRLEVQVRKSKQRRDSAADPLARRRANADVRRWQTRIREHIAKTGITRVPLREQINQAR